MNQEPLSHDLIIEGIISIAQILLGNTTKDDLACSKIHEIKVLKLNYLCQFLMKIQQVIIMHIHACITKISILSK